MNMKPLHDILVVDLTRVLAGPFCTQLLLDLGAEIIKVEIPETGDDSRAFGPFQNERSAYFMSVNRGKKSITLNMKTEKGKEIIRELAKRADVLVENFRPGTMEKLGLGYDKLKELNPRLIYAACSGFGHSGPYSKRPAYDMIVQAMGGIMGLTGQPDGPPVRVGSSVGDLTAGLFTAYGIAVALFDRNRTGLGRKVDVAMLDSQVAFLENAIVRYTMTGEIPGPLGTRHPSIAPFQAFKTADSWLIIAAGNDNLWQAFAKAMDRPDWLEKEQFATNALRVQNVAQLENEISQLIITKTNSEWTDILDKAQVPCAPISRINDVVDNPQVNARNMICEIHDPVAGIVRVAGNPVKMSGLPDEKIRPPAPGLGEYTNSVLSHYLGFGDEEIENLKKEGVI